MGAREGTVRDLERPRERPPRACEARAEWLASVALGDIPAVPRQHSLWRIYCPSTSKESLHCVPLLRARAHALL
ncbi:hypothetical protein PsYK624_064960 [Phanerochaete sordida]|uniref:Uncharacterized protein n=1 Tax=Phanerochaete sordida TaxID=48140 RepID=A0A9P3G9E7_9APHY|nr:hypothetical protein PsYK624_064960 [Phanerochaete sordida]